MTAYFWRILRSLVLFGGLLALISAADAQAPSGAPPALQPTRTITAPIDEAQLSPLARAVHPAAINPANDRGRVGDDFALPHLLLQLQRSPAQEQALDQLIDQLHDPRSPNFHRWLTVDEFGARFGLAAQDVQTITGWLQQHGFTVNFVYPNGTLVDFSGTAGQVRAAFHTEIHRLSVSGESHFANMSAPQIPAALAGAVIGIAGLNDFKPQRQVRPRAAFTTSQGNALVVPADLATIYNFNPLFSAGISGQGETIALIEDTDISSGADWLTFRSTFGLSGFPGSFGQMHPAPTGGGSNCSDPGLNADDGEAILDLEWASAAAPSATVLIASCANTPDGLLIAVQNLVNGANPPPIISISYGQCEADSTDAAAFNAAYQQAVTEGISVFVATGDSGAALCDQSDPPPPYATRGIGVNALASTPYDVAVGGTDFADSLAPIFGFGHGDPSAYWSASNGPTFGSALSYVPEIPWNDSCADNLTAIYVSGSGEGAGAGGFCNNATAQADGLLNIGAGSGGPSTIYAKPSWQGGLVGVPNDGKRDLPDVSLFAGNGLWGHAYVFCWSDPSQTANGSAPCSGDPSTWSAAGGTSFSTPILAGIQALVDQENGGRQGNPNTVYYTLAAQEYGGTGNRSCNSTVSGSPVSTCTFYDVTEGSNDVPCIGSNDCYLPSGTYGVLSTSDAAESAAYLALGGWDFASGIGTVNANNLVRGWKINTLPTTITVSVTGNGAVTSSPAGINCGTTCSATFSEIQQVTLIATPASGWNFGGWGGACAGSNGNCVIVGEPSPEVTATFNPNSPPGTFPVTISASTGGTVTSSPAGIQCGGGFSTCSFDFPAGQQVEVTQNPSPGWVQFLWFGPCEGAGPSCFFSVNRPINETAIFGANLTVQVSGLGTVTSSSPADEIASSISCPDLLCRQTFPAGQQVMLTETPSPGWVFSGWGGACAGTGACQVPINGAATVTANFGPPAGIGSAWSYTCTGTSADNLSGALAGTAAWSSTTSLAAQANNNIGQPSPGDLIVITNTCLGDIKIPVNDIILTNHDDTVISPFSTSFFPDGIEGQVEIAGVTGVVIRNLALRGTSGATSDVANLYIHDNAAANLEHDYAGLDWVGTGIAIFGNSGLTLLDSQLLLDRGSYGILTDGGSTLTLGNPDGSEPSKIGDTTSILVSGIALQGHSNAEIYGSTIATNAPNQIIASESSSASLRGTQVTPAASTGPALQAIAGSSLTFGALANGVGTTVNGDTSSAVVLANMSSTTIHGATLASASAQQPTIESSSDSAIILAGGNSITNSAAGGAAVQIDHSSSLVQEPGSFFGFANAADAIAGAGTIQVESSIALGVGLVSGNPSLVWTVPSGGNITVQQNSTLLLSGGVTITGPGGTVRLQQGSNAFINTANGGSNNANLVCVSSANNPAVHVAGATSVNPPITNYDFEDVLTGDPAATHPGQSNACLNF